MRAKYPLLVLVLLLVSGFLGYQRYRARQRSPFPLGMAAAGMRYQELVDAEDRGEKLNLKCRSIPSGYRICDADTDGPNGHILAAVNDKGRIAVLRMRFDDTSYRVLDLTSKMASSWDEVGPRTTTSVEGEGDILNWRSPDKRWSVEMLMRRTIRTPQWVLMRDDGGLASSADRSIPAMLALAREGLIGEDVLDAAETNAPGSLLRAADTLSASGRALALHAATLPLCAPEPALAVLPGTNAREALGEPLASIAIQSIAIAYPGHQLVLGESAYLVDSTGQGEQISLTPLSGDGSGTTYLFALNFQSRVDAAVARAESFSIAGQCRAPADVIVAHVDTASGAVASAIRAPVEAEALASKVERAAFTTTAEEKRAITISYKAYYGDAEFFGDINWLAVMPLDSMKLRSRLPVDFARQDASSHAASGTFSYPTGEEGIGGPSGSPPDRGPLGGRRLHASTKRDDRSGLEMVVVPSPVNGLASGWSILAMFRE